MFAKIDTVLANHGINIREISARLVGSGGDVQAVHFLHNQVGPQILRELEAIEGVYGVKK